ncbi:CRISPR-associated helicase Cas3' [Ammonifex thiophilus]|uniref:CRISPR-associated helicase Cas3 n=1 Tax=Ammonifex thiophilus TaxID=444093 RepID=A0A3D8P6F7_9THEO|nr:CRISPR-associated helicase Cas3' [Ammonifex thiophilus]RDV83594.1 CRISPR-associated helicase Cas3' [Ammonifex thiophilus]
MAFYAHCDREGERIKRLYRLSAHLALVAAASYTSLARLPRYQKLLPLAATVGLAHDFGKYTSYFQNYLLKGEVNPYKEHAFISGLWATYLAARQGAEPLEQLAAFMAVLWHHRDLDNLDRYLASRREMEDISRLDPDKYRRLEVVEKQVEDLRRNVEKVGTSLISAARHLARLLARLGFAPPPFLTQDWRRCLEEFLGSWREVYLSLYRHWRKFERQEPSLSPYFSVVLLFSALIDADKRHSARVREVKRPELPSDLICLYKERKFSGAGTQGINALREEIFRHAAERIARAPFSQRFFTLTAPTGSGKTLTVLNTALILRQRLKEAYGFSPRIIYALPFTSIIDQTYQVLYELMEETLPGFVSAPSVYLLKHHHLAEISYKDPEDEDPRRFDEAMLLIESWQSEVVVTTFVQLLHTLIGYRNRMLKKFCHLGRAIIIMDEVQNIPVEYWPLVTEVLKRAAEELDLRLILMTATRPEWFEPGEALELAGELEDIERYFKMLDRVRLLVEPGQYRVAEAAELFARRYDPSQSHLVVLNTIRSSVDFYHYLKDLLPEGTPLYYLSTNIVPAEREKRIEALRTALHRGEKPVLVSTQVVEAGVDLDFDVAWRDIGPVDAVVQVAGRCNRNFKRDKGDVYLLNLVDEQGHSLAVRVYGAIHIKGAREFFSGRPEFPEAEFHSLVENFFSFVRARKDPSASDTILKAMKELRFKGDGEEKGVAGFQLIKDLPNHIEVFVALDPKAEEVWEAYQQEVVNAPDRRSRWEAFYRIKRDFSRYIISVPVRSLAGKVDTSKALPYIPPYLVEELYDPETGFKRVDEGAVII